jgi:YHS domain-containing protein
MGRPWRRSAVPQQIKYDGATYYFRSSDNKAAFGMEPERYAPEYGGYCAMVR